MQCAALRRHHVEVHAPLSVEATMIIDDTGRVHAHTLILNASCISVNVRSVRQSTQRLQGNNTNLTNLPPIEKPR